MANRLASWGQRRRRAATVLAIALGLAIAVGVVLATRSSGGSQSHPAGPSLALTTRSYALGTVVPGQDATGALPVRNAGTGTLVVRTVRSSNRSLTAHVTPTTLRPGQRATLRLVLRSNTYDPEGAFTDWVLLYSDDPRAAVVKIAVHRTMAAPIGLRPKLPLLGPLRADGKTLTLSRLFSKNKAPLGSVQVKSFVPFLEARAIREAPDSYRIAIKLSRGVPLGLLIGWIRIETGNSRMPAVEIPIRTVVVNNVQLSPPQLDFGVVDARKPATARLTLLVRPGHPVRVVKVDPHLPAPAKISTVLEPNKDVQLEVTLLAVRSRRSLGGNVNVYTDDPLQPVIQIPVVGFAWMRNPFLGGGGTRLYPLLKAALFEIDDKKFPPTFIAQEILGGVRDERAVSLLLRAMKDENWYVRQRAVDVLGVIKNPRTVAAIRSAMTGDVDEDVRTSAEKALVNIVGSESVPDLLLAIQDNDPGVRATAATLLGRVGGSRAIPALTKAQADEDSFVREAATRALKKLRTGG